MYSELFEVKSYNDIMGIMKKYHLKKKFNDDYIMLYSNFLTQPLDNYQNTNDLMKYKNIIFDKHNYNVISITHKRISNNDQIQITNIELQQKKR